MGSWPDDYRCYFGQSGTPEWGINQINHWQTGRKSVITTSRFLLGGGNFNLKKQLCHSIAACAQRPLWAANGTFSSVLSAPNS
jgi:hypothetical protein